MADEKRKGVACYVLSYVKRERRREDGGVSEK
jgi:hypothetical protein